MKPHSTWSRYGYLWVTLVLFLGSLLGHWIFGWYHFVSEQQAHNQPIEVKKYLIELSKDTLENWQSEFLQLMWQVAGLAFLLYVGSPQSKEGSDRLEEKVDLILEAVAKDGKKTIAHLDSKYDRV